VFFIHREREGPDIIAGAILPTVIRPSIVADFARMGEGVEGPEFLAGADVIAMRVGNLTANLIELRISSMFL
jgi:hypothetical protein